MLVLEGLVRLHRTVQLLQHYWWGIDFHYCLGQASETKKVKKASDLASDLPGHCPDCACYECKLSGTIDKIGGGSWNC